MSNFIESSAGRIAARMQSIGANFDPEILSLPGGSVMAVLLWAYATTMLTLTRDKAPRRDTAPTIDTPAKPCFCSR